MLRLGDEYFAEGLTRTDDNKVYQLTYIEGKTFVYQLKNDKLKLIETKGMPRGSYMT